MNPNPSRDSNNNGNNGNNGIEIGITQMEINEEKEFEEKEKANAIKNEIKNNILAEIKDELFQEMKNKNEQLLNEIKKLKNEINDINNNSNKKKAKKTRNIFSRHNAVASVHNEWPKLDKKDRASLRKKLAKEIKQHHNKKKKRTFKLEKKLLKKERKLEKYEREIYKLQKQLQKHGVKYVGPPEEDGIWRLACCLSYKSQATDAGVTDSDAYERRHSISHAAAKMEERQVQRKWAELFTDLIFVAIIVKFASQINSQYIFYCKLGDTYKMVTTLLNGLLFFLPFWCLWLELTVTLIRFHDFEGKWYGLVDDTLIFIILAGVIEISFQIDINADLFAVQYANRFLLGFGLCIIALLLLHIFYRWKLKETAKRYCRRRIYSYSMALMVLFLPMIDSSNPLYIILAIILSCIIMLYVSLVSFRVHTVGDIYNIFCLESIVERFGIFSMIVIGESILALLISPDPGSFIRYICVYFAFALLFVFQLMYFGSHAEETCHALHKIESPGAVAWIFMHLPLSTSLLFVGIGLRLLVAFADLDIVPPQISIILIIGTDCTIINYYILRQCHDKYKSFSAVSIILRLIPIIICPLCLLIEPGLDSFGIILWCFIITISSWFYDVILINEYETKPVWMNELVHQYQSGHHGEFEFHPEEYNPLFLPIDSWLFCKNYDGEHGRTIVVSLAEYIVDDQTLHTIHEIEHSLYSMYSMSKSNMQHSKSVATPGIKVTHNDELHDNLPTSPKAYLDQISHKIDVSGNLASFFRGNSVSKSHKKHKGTLEQTQSVSDHSNDDDDDDDDDIVFFPETHANIHIHNSNSNTNSNANNHHMKQLTIHDTLNLPVTPYSQLSSHHHHEAYKDPSIQSIDKDPPLPPLTPPNNISINSQIFKDHSIIVHKTPTVLAPNTPITPLFDNNPHVQSYHEIEIAKRIALTKQEMIKNKEMKKNEERESKKREAAMALYNKHHQTKLVPSVSQPQLPLNVNVNVNKTKLHPPSRSSMHIMSDDDEIDNIGVGSGVDISHPFKMQRTRSHEPDNQGIIDWDSIVHEFEEEHDENEEHRHQWFSEFADLVFVAIIINFADQIKNISINECLSSNNYIELNCLSMLFVEAGIFFLSFFMVWYELSVTLIRFTEIPGIFDDILKFLYLAGIVSMTLQMSKEEFLSSNIGGFITGIIICLLCITLLHIVYYFHVENCQLYARKRIILYFFSIICLFVVSIIDDIFLSELCIIFISVLILWISSNSFRVILTPNDEMLELPQDVFENIVERWGIFVMIATGESILALIATTNKLNVGSHEKEKDITFQHYISILCAFGITYLVSHYYLESSKINSMHFHALMHPGSPGSVIWTLLHGVLAFFLMLVGAGWKLLLLSLSLEICWIDAEKYYEYYDTKESIANNYVLQLKDECCQRYHILGDCYDYSGNGWIEFSVILGCALTLSLITMYLLRTSHPKFIFSWKSIILRFPIIFIIPCGAYWTNSFQTQSFYYSVWCLILMTISYFVDHLFIDIYQSDIKPELRTFYRADIAPELRQQTLQLHLMESKRKSLEFGRSSSYSNHPT